MKRVAWGLVDAVNTDIGINIPRFWCKLAIKETDKELNELLKHEKVGKNCREILILNEGEEPAE